MRGPKGGGPKGGRGPKISRFFSPSRLHFSFFLSGGGLLSFAGVFEGRDPQMCTFGFSGCRVKPWHGSSLESTFKRREDLCKHSVYTHFPTDRNCEICQRTKITRAPCRRRCGGAVPRAQNFGDLITADHKVLSDNCESRNNHRYAVVVQDLATQWIQAYPCKTKT